MSAPTEPVVISGKPNELSSAVLPRTHASMVPVRILGKPYEVPLGLTILKAYEYAGFRMVRGVGCRGGICGACATVYRMDGDHRRKTGLACQTAVRSGMILAPLPFYPTTRPDYDLAAFGDPALGVVQVYPEVQNCLGCNACNKICPQGIDVMGYIAAILKGDLEKASDLSFDCIMCGLCASTCPAEISQLNTALLARRLYARYMIKGSSKVPTRVAEIRSGRYEAELSRLVAADESELKKLYAARELPGTMVEK